MRKLLPVAATLIFFVLPASALANTFTFTAPTTASNTTGSTSSPSSPTYNGGVNQFNLDHHYAYTWKLSGLAVPAGHTIISASICFKDIANWDANANKLFVHLLNSSTYSGVANVVDNADDTTISDYFGGASSTALAPGLGSNNIKLFEKSFNMVGQAGYVAQNYVYNFTPAQLATLAAFISSGSNLAFGFDPDCHYWNNGITFTYVTAPAVPEPTTLLLLGSGLAGIYLRRKRRAS